MTACRSARHKWLEHMVICAVESVRTLFQTGVFMKTMLITGASSGIGAATARAAC
jgi:hypothetical protein